jgi:hypothetical protein
MRFMIFSRALSLTGRVWDSPRVDLPLICCTGGNVDSDRLGPEIAVFEVCKHYKRVFGIEGVSGRCLCREDYPCSSHVVGIDYRESREN